MFRAGLLLIESIHQMTSSKPARNMYRLIIEIN